MYSDNSVISYCVPVMNRTYDLKVALPHVIEAARNSPPVEITIVDYNSQDDLREYLKSVGKGFWELNYGKYDKRDHFHMAHARNLTIRLSSGQYLVISSADIIPKPNYFEVIREYLAKGNVWLHHHERFIGVFCCEREEIVDAGGFDERFEFYGKEDKDIVLRLKRRGKKHEEIADRTLLSLIPTPWEDKLKNYRGNMTRADMRKISKPLYEENIANKVLVANEGKNWGEWL